MIVLFYPNFPAEMQHPFLPSLTSQIYIYMYVCVYECIRRYMYVFLVGLISSSVTILGTSFNTS